MNPQLQEILKLSKPERILMVEAIWDSIADEGDEGDFELTEAQQKELDLRSKNIRTGKSRLSSWDEVESRIRTHGKE